MWISRIGLARAECSAFGVDRVTESSSRAARSASVRDSAHGNGGAHQTVTETAKSRGGSAARCQRLVGVSTLVLYPCGLFVRTIVRLSFAARVNAFHIVPQMSRCHIANGLQVGAPRLRRMFAAVR